MTRLVLHSKTFYLIELTDLHFLFRGHHGARRPKGILPKHINPWP